MKTNLAAQLDVNTSLLSQQATLTTKYDDAIAVSQSVQQRQNDLIAEIEILHEAIHQLCPNKALLNIDSIGKPAVTAPALKSVATPNPTLSSTPPPQLITSRTMTVPTAAALKMGVGFPLNSLRRDDTGRILSTQCASNVEHELLNECGICKKCTEQHLLAKCDTCRLYYHLGCLNPPLSRHPKRSKQYAWQCSECDKSDDSAPENVIIPKGPRRSRIRYSKDGPIYPDPLRDSFGSDQSLAMSRKSDDFRVVNGSESEYLQETKSNRKTAAEVKLIPDTPTVIPVSDSFADGLVPTTSTPINAVKSDTDEKPSPKKRGRKPKPKPSLTDNSSAATTPAIGSPVQSAPPKDIASPENHVADLNGFNQQELIISKAENFVPTTFPDLSKIASEPPKAGPKKGRPPKPKPSITQISNKLQKKQESIENSTKEVKEEVSLLDLSRKFDCPLEQFRPYADIPNSIPFDEFPKLADEHEAIPTLTGTAVATTEPVMYVNGAMLNGEGTASSGSTHHKHKKQKHRKRRHSTSSGERVSVSKKHKKKKKHRTGGMLTTDQATVESPRLPEQPSLKLKFCAKIVQDGTDKKIKTWSLPQAGMEPKQELYPSSSYEDLLNTSSQVRKNHL